MSHQTERIAAARPRFLEEDIAEISRDVEAVLRSGRLVLGPRTTELERRFADYVGVEHAVAVSSCTAAIQISLRFIGVRGREVIVPTNNFPGILSAVLYEGGTPVLADMDPTTFGPDVEDIASRVTPNTAGVIVTHIGGLVCPEIGQLRSVCQAKGLFLLEDASHAHGASIDGQNAGSLADAGCFSFYPTKIMTTGTGGMLTTQHAELAELARSLRHHGQGGRRNEFVRLGNDWCLGEIQAVLGLHQLKRVDENVEHRNRVVDWYRESLADADWLTIPSPPPNARHAYYKLLAVLDEKIDANRFRRILDEEYGIENGNLYLPPCHLQPVFLESLGHEKGAFPRAERMLERQVCPPVHSSLGRDDVNRVVEALRAVKSRLSPEPARD